MIHDETFSSRLDRGDRLVELVESGMTYRAAGRLSGLSPEQVRQIVQFTKRWRRIPDDPRDRCRPYGAREVAA